MASGSLARVLDRLHGPNGPGGLRALTDGQLLEGFADRGEEGAFEELVRRHGPMVLGVCRRVLGADADDAFQAVFLVLVLRARAIRKRASVGSWLYGVAYRVARRARAEARRRDSAHRRLGPPRDEPPAEPSHTAEVWPVLDEELGRLPDKYRAPLVLCYLQGKTNEQAARELGWPSGSMSRRLARARELLRARLVRRGVALAVGTALTATVPEALARATVRAGRGATSGGAVPPAAAALAKGAIHTMFLTRVKTVLLGVFAVGLLGAAAGLLLDRALAASPSGQAAAAPAPGEKSEKGGRPAPKKEAAGDKDAKPAGKEKAAAAKGEILALAFSPDGTTVAVGTADKVQIGDVRTWKPLRQFKPGARALAFSPDGRFLAVAGAKGDAQARLVDAGTGREVHALAHDGDVTDVAFSPDGKVAVTASKDKSVRLWDVATGREIRRLQGPQGAVLALAYASDGATIVSGAADGSLLQWDVQTGKILSKSQGHEGAVTSLAISPDSQTVASAGADGTVRLWELETGKALAKLDGHRGGAWSVAYSPDGKRLVTTGKDDKVRLWDVAAGQGTALPGEAVRVRAARFSPDGRFVVFGSGGDLRVWDIARKNYVTPAGK